MNANFIRKILIPHLAKAESTKIHKNTKEKDITSPYGIYRKDHPDDPIFFYIDQRAKDVGVTKKSSSWSKSDIEKVNSEIDPDEIISLAVSFYSIFFKRVAIRNIPTEAQLAFMSMYTNSPQLATMALQRTLINIKKTGNVTFLKPLSIEDGFPGFKTNRGLKVIADISFNPWFGLYFETQLTTRMKTLYAELAVDNPEDFLLNLNGWNNRMSILEEEK